MYKLHLEYTVHAAGILSLKETMTGLHLATLSWHGDLSLV
jgi:hypothetical protein